MKKLNHKLYQFKIENDKQQLIKGGEDDAKLTWPWNDTNMNSETSKAIDLNTGWPRDVTSNDTDSHA